MIKADVDACLDALRRQNETRFYQEEVYEDRLPICATQLRWESPADSGSWGSVIWTGLGSG